MNKICTDITQSKKLMELGVDINSADTHYVRQKTDFMGNPVDGKWSEPRYGNTNSKYAHYVVQNFSSYETLPAWSLSALLSFLPFDLIVNNRRYIFSMCKSFNKNGETYAIKYAIFNTTFYLHLTDFYNNPIDAAFEMVVWLKENNKI